MERSLGGGSSVYSSSSNNNNNNNYNNNNENDGTASVATLPTFIQQALDQEHMQGERSYAEFQEWLATNREWTKKRQLKVT